MLRKTLKWLLGIVALLLIATAVFLINLIWFRPLSLNLFYEKVFAQVLFEEPELLTSLGLVEQFGITGICSVLFATLWFNVSVKPVNKDQRKLAVIIQLRGTDMVDRSGLFDRTRHSGWNQFQRGCRPLQTFRN